jgi:hypothetical protein
MDLKFSLLFNYLNLLFILIYIFRLLKSFLPTHLKAYLESITKNNQLGCGVITLSIFFLCHWCSGSLSYCVSTFFSFNGTMRIQMTLWILIRLYNNRKNKQHQNYLLLMTNILAYSFKISMLMWKGFNIDIALTQL